MSTLAVVGAVAQPVLVVGGSPLLLGVMRQVGARLGGRAGAGIWQPWRDLRKLMRKEPITPRGTSEVFRYAPIVLMATTLVVVVVAPFVTTESAVGPVADLFAVVALLALGTVALALAGLDTATAFGGMGASREMTIIALVEPTLLVAILALSVRVGSTNLAAIVSSTLHEPGRVISPVSVLAAVALGVVTIAETGRLPVDNPSTHLELTMVHEALILEYSARHLALLEWAASLKLFAYSCIGLALFFPWGVAEVDAPLAMVYSLPALALKLAIGGVLLALIETVSAKMRIFRVPEFLAAAFLLAVIGLLVHGLLGA
jgi:formate hydrogenlyase subunit 4